MRAIIHFVVRLWFRFRCENTQVLVTPGPVLLLPNHTSWLDWAFLAAVLDDDWKFVTSAVTSNASWFHRKIMINRRTFPIDTASPYAAKRMAEFLEKGGRLVLFPEGRISTTGALMKLFDGTGFLLHRTRATVITCYLQHALRVPFVRHTGWTRWFPQVTAHFSAVLTPPRLTGISNVLARQKMTLWLRDQMVRQQFDVEMSHGPRHVLAAIAEAAARQPGKEVIEDITLQPLSFRKLMVGVEVLAEQWVQGSSGMSRVPGEHVGVLLPNVNGMPVTVLSLWAAGKVPAILNFSTGMPTMVVCAQLAGLKRIITSRVFVEKAKLEMKVLSDAGIELIYLEDVRTRISGARKFGALLKNIISCGGGYHGMEDSGAAGGSSGTAVILFTSGSEGVPKGVELTHRNLLANIRQINVALDLTDHERFFNALPLFHSFGLTACTLFPLVRGFYIFLYPTPLHYRMVPAAVYDRNCTVTVGTNTFLNGYARKAHPYDFHSVKYLVAGAEKVQESTAQTWAQKFGIRLLEGYGATECSPVLSVNTRLEPRFGSVGRFLPGMEYRLEHVEGVSNPAPSVAPATGNGVGAPPPVVEVPQRIGRLFVKGPNVMKGYLNPEANAKFLELAGWYDTGDLARVDEDGYVFLLGRMKRFAKVSGEMVSLTAVEDALAGAFPQFGQRCEVAVVAVPDIDKGEKLVAISNEPRLKIEDLRSAIRAKGMTNLCIPREIRSVREIPKLGTGKVNHRALLEQVTG